MNVSRVASSPAKSSAAISRTLSGTSSPVQAAGATRARARAIGSCDVSASLLLGRVLNPSSMPPAGMARCS